MRLPAILEVSVDGPHGERGTLTHRLDGLGDAIACERQARQMIAAKARGQGRFSVLDADGEEVISLPLDRVTGVRVYRPDLDHAFLDQDCDRKTAAAGG